VIGKAAMVSISFPNRETEKKALGILISGRFSGSVLSTGEHFVPEEALKVLKERKVPFTVHGSITEEQRQQAMRQAVVAREKKE
jgi:hypothetical protein